MYFDWLSYSPSICDRPLVAKWIIAENARFAEISVRFFKIVFYPTSWFILKQLDNLPSLSISDSELGCATLTICSWTTRARCLPYLMQRWRFATQPFNYQDLTIALQDMGNTSLFAISVRISLVNVRNRIQRKYKFILIKSFKNNLKGKDLKGMFARRM